MAISKHGVRHVAALARIALSDEQVKRFEADLNSVLGHVEAIRRLDLSEVEPTAHALDVVNEVRPDVLRPCLDQATALGGASRVETGAFVAPRMTRGGAQ